MFPGRKLMRFLLIGIMLVFGASLTMAAAYSNNTGADLDLESTTQTVTVAGEGTVTYVTISIRFLKTDGSCAAPLLAGQPFNGETVFRLTSPSGTIVNLVNANTYPTDDGDVSSGTVTVVFDPAASEVVGGNPTSGTFRPVGDLTTFIGETADGDWTLYIEDTVALDPLCVFEWTLNVNTGSEVGVPPTFTPGFDVPADGEIVLEDGGAYSAVWATNIVAVGTPVFTLTTDNDALFSALPAIAADGTLTFTSAADEFGSAIVTVTLTDATGQISDPVNFTITVTPVNDAPLVENIGDVEVLEDSGAYSEIWATTLSTGPANEADQTIISLALENDDPALFAVEPALAADGTLTFTPADETFGIALVTVTVQDDGGTDNGGEDTTVVTFEIRVLPVNDPPVCDAALADPDVLWPPNHRMVEITIGNITDPDSSIFTFLIDEVLSDEPENGLGDGNTAPDYEITDTTLDTGEATQIVSVRSERSGLGDGRTYTITFTVDDADFTIDLGDDFTEEDVVDGGSCTNSITVFVPHDMRNGLTNPNAVSSLLSNAGVGSISSYVVFPPAVGDASADTPAADSGKPE
jgi:hypothetical protein